MYSSVWPVFLVRFISLSRLLSLDGPAVMHSHQVLVLFTGDMF